MNSTYSVRTICLAVAAAAGLAGCITVGSPFPRNSIDTIVIGKTTQSQIENTFGMPFRTGLEDGDLTWTYVHYHLGLTKKQIATDLYVRFNPDGTVKSYSYSSNE